MKTNAWIAWALLLAAWVGLIVYVVATMKPPVCDPQDPTIAVRLAQGDNAKEVGVIYLNWRQARMTERKLDEWVRRYGKC